MLSTIHHNTPVIQVSDPRTLGLRQNDYYRSQSGQTPQARITLSRHDAAARHARQWDPRLFARLAAGENARPNQATLSSLCGQVLLEENADAGWRLILPGEAGQTLQRWDSRGSHWVHDYDQQLRPLSVRESTPDEPPRVAERYAWGAAWEHQGNRCGRLLRHDDDAGSRMLQAYDLTGQATDETRHFLASLDPPDWPVATEARDALLEPGDGACTRYRHNPLGELLEQTDACGNRQRTQVNLSGELTGLDVVQADGAVHPLLLNARYNALGQIVGQTAGNGVVSHFEYDPANQRLTRLTARRPQRGVLLDLHYGYDPVGNVLHSEDLSQPTRHFANQKIDPLSTFCYDSLYQLIAASGREVSTGAGHGPALPGLEHLPADLTRMTNYTQHYDYDAAGNLVSLRHLGSQPFTRDYHIAADSNRCLPPELRRARFADAFDANGNLRQLLPGQTLHWNPRNQLHALTTVQREKESDGEQYRYGGNGKRCRKSSSAQASGRRLVDEVRYLPGLELRRTASGEVLQVITAMVGPGEVRVLHWKAGKPDDLANDQIRYSLRDHLGSSTLELDQQASLISQELYYPFGGTAWWAGRSAIEASYKTVRYSGKERDASGLYDYGLRYYAPWLQRWISPDPAGDVDGLNRYRMVGNNPTGFVDDQGLMMRNPSESNIIKALDLPPPPSLDAVSTALMTDPTLRQRRSDASSDTGVILDLARKNSLRLKGLKTAQQVRFGAANPHMMTEKRLPAAAAHAAISWNKGRMQRSGFTNLPGSLSPKDTFPGVTLLPPAFSLNLIVPPAFAAGRQGLGFYQVSNVNALLAGVRKAYHQDGTVLHPYIERRIREHIENSHYRIPVKAGIPGLHAEVQALNTRLNLMTEDETLSRVLSDAVVFTERLVPGKGLEPGADFTACYNCDGIIAQLVRVVTGRGATPERSPLHSARSTPPKSPGPL